MFATRQRKYDKESECATSGLALKYRGQRAKESDNGEGSKEKNESEQEAGQSGC